MSSKAKLDEGNPPKPSPVLTQARPIQEVEQDEFKELLIAMLPVGFQLGHCPEQGFVVRNLNCKSEDRRKYGACICEQCKFVHPTDPFIALVKAIESLT